MWVAGFGSSRVLCVDPSRGDRVLQHVQLPTSVVTSVCFAGSLCNELCVTSSRYQKTEQDEFAGATFRVTGLDAGARGLPFDCMF